MQRQHQPSGELLVVGLLVGPFAQPRDRVGVVAQRERGIRVDDVGVEPPIVEMADRG